MTATQTFEITLVNRADGTIDGHKPGCRDIARAAKADGIFGDQHPWTFAVASKRDAYLEYNSDFIAETGEEEGHWEISWLPCTNHVPATAADASTTQKENDMSTTATTTEAVTAHPVIRTYNTEDAKLQAAALTATCPIPYCAATPGVSCHSAGGKDVQAHTKRVQKATKPAKAAKPAAPKSSAKAAAKPAAPKPEPKPEPEPTPICKPCLTRHHKSCKGTTEAPCGCESSTHAA